MSDQKDLASLARAIRKQPIVTPLVCPCGGSVVLNGGETLGYRCMDCNVVRPSLAELVPAKGKR